MHKEKEWWQSYYKGVLWADAASTFIGGAAIAGDAAKAASAYLRSGAVARNVTRLAQSAAASDRLAEKASEAGGKALRGTLIHGGAMTTSYLLGFEVGEGRRIKMEQFDPFIEQTLKNIEDLSRGASSANAELQNLGCQR